MIPYYRLTKKEVLTKLKSHEAGISETEANSLLKKYGKNTIDIEEEVSFLKLLFQQFNSYLIWLLVFIAVFAFITGFLFKKQEQIVDGFIISLIIIINVFIGAYQDYKSENTAKLLKTMLKNTALILRSGVKKKVDAELLVPGDIIFLGEGDKIPADARILECHDLVVDESLLTGESRGVSKNSTVIKKEVPIAERKNMVYMNTYVLRGSAKCVVVATGRLTEVGKIADSLNVKQGKSPFIEEVDSASKKITYVALALIAVVLLVFSFKSDDWISLFMLASALIIGAIPEGLPAIVTFALAMGSLRLAKKNVLVKRKTLLETLGSVDVICTDKTGTLTENRMVIKKIWIDGSIYLPIDDFRGEAFKLFRDCALLSNEAKLTEDGFSGVPEDIALINFFNSKGIKCTDVRSSYETVKFEPFSSDTKRVRGVFKKGNSTLEFSKGAPEVILKECSHVILNGRVVKLDSVILKKIDIILKSFSDEALRNIAYMVYRDEKKILIGITGMYDKPKKDVPRTIKVIYGAGIEIKMITGDSEETAKAIARECGFRNIKAISWNDLKELSDEEFKKVVEECNVFARMTPELKLRVVKALQENGHRVAITGDGVNDVPALKAAEVGIAMGKRGSDIAKEAGDIILLDDNLSSILESIKEGRTIFANVRKVINYLLTANLAEVIAVFVGSMWGVLLLLPIQLIWVNFVTDVAPAMCLGIDPPHKDIMKKKPTGKNEKIINKRITLLTVFIGLKKVIMMVGLFWMTYKLSKNLVMAQTISFTWLVFSHFVRIAAIRFDEGVNMFINKYLNWSVLLPVIFQFFIIYTPLSHFFQVEPLTHFEWLILFSTFALALVLARVITYVIDKNLPPSERDY